MIWEIKLYSVQSSLVRLESRHGGAIIGTAFPNLPSIFLGSIGNNEPDKRRCYHG
jgi:hypothetical protein